MKVHIINGYIQNIFLVEYPDKLLLFDSGCRTDVKTIVDFITLKLKREMSDLKLILVSHIHPDHAGGAAKIRRLYGTKILMAEKANTWYSKPKGLNNCIIDLLLTYYVAYKMKKPLLRNIFYSPFLNPDISIDEESPVPGFEDWQIISSPGHTKTDLSFYHKERKLLYIGDNLVKVRNKFIIPHPISYPTLYKRSLERYLDLDVQSYLLAHGGECEISNDQIEEVIELVKPMPITNNHIFRQVLRNIRKHRRIK